MIGKTIKTFSHAKDWCLEQRRPVCIRSKNGVLAQHGWKMIAHLEFKALYTMMNEGRLFELHAASKE